MRAAQDTETARGSQHSSRRRKRASVDPQHFTTGTHDTPTECSKLVLMRAARATETTRRPQHSSRRRKRASVDPQHFTTGARGTFT
eukprot:687082-Pyramimonas_sp.AAC.1